MRQVHKSLPTIEPVTLLLPGKVADVPTDTIHWKKTAAGVGVRDTRQRTPKFTARKTQLQHEWMRHGFGSFLPERMPQG
jgi:hypothetical protein